MCSMCHLQTLYMHINESMSMLTFKPNTSESTHQIVDSIYKIRSTDIGTGFKVQNRSIGMDLPNRHITIFFRIHTAHFIDYQIGLHRLQDSQE